MTTSETFNRLYADCHTGIGKHVGAMMRTYPDEVDDIVQDTWCKVWRALPAEEREPSYRWVQRIATNTALDVLKARSIHHRIAPTFSIDCVPVSEESHTDTPRSWEEILIGEADVSEAMIARERIAAILRRFNQSYRRILLLNYQGYSPQEIADRQEASGESLKTRYSIRNALSQAHMKARAARDYEEARSG